MHQSSQSSRPSANLLTDALTWARFDGTDASMASADWLARDIDPASRSAVAFLVDERRSLSDLRSAKHVYKMLRIVGETARDRRVGARLYLASIAAAYIHHDQLISSQSEAALLRGLQALMRDERMDKALRDLAEQAFWKLSRSIAGARTAADEDDSTLPLAADESEDDPAEPPAA